MHNELEWVVMKGIMLNPTNRGFRELYDNLTMPQSKFDIKYPEMIETQERELGQ